MNTGSAPSISRFEPVLLLLGREVRREEEDRQVAVAVQRVGELAELLAHVIEAPCSLATSNSERA